MLILGLKGLNRVISRWKCRTCFYLPIWLPFNCCDDLYTIFTIFLYYHALIHHTEKDSNCVHLTTMPCEPNKANRHIKNPCFLQKFGPVLATLCMLSFKFSFLCIFMSVPVAIFFGMLDCAFDIDDPSSMQDVCHNELSKCDHKSLVSSSLSG